MKYILSHLVLPSYLQVLIEVRVHIKVDSISALNETRQRSIHRLPTSFRQFVSAEIEFVIMWSPLIYQADSGLRVPTKRRPGTLISDNEERRTDLLFPLAIRYDYDNSSNI